MTTRSYYIIPLSSEHCSELNANKEAYFSRLKIIYINNVKMTSQRRVEKSFSQDVYQMVVYSPVIK